MGYKDPIKQKEYQAAWFKRTYVPHPKPAPVVLTDEERRAKHKAYIKARREAMTQEQKDKNNSARRAKRRLNRLAAGLKPNRTKESAKFIAGACVRDGCAFPPQGNFNGKTYCGYHMPAASASVVASDVVV